MIFLQIQFPILDEYIWVLFLNLSKKPEDIHVLILSELILRPIIEFLLPVDLMGYHDTIMIWSVQYAKVYFTVKLVVVGT